MQHICYCETECHQQEAMVMIYVYYRSLSSSSLFVY